MRLWKYLNFIGLWPRAKVTMFGEMASFHPIAGHNFCFIARNVIVPHANTFFFSLPITTKTWISRKFIRSQNSVVRADFSRQFLSKSFFPVYYHIYSIYFLRITERKKEKDFFQYSLSTYFFQTNRWRRRRRRKESSLGYVCSSYSLSLLGATPFINIFLGFRAELYFLPYSRELNSGLRTPVHACIESFYLGRHDRTIARHVFFGVRFFSRVRVHRAVWRTKRISISYLVKHAYRYL